MAVIPSAGTAIYLGRFDPPTKYHRHTAERLAQQFRQVIVRPTSPRRGRTADENLPIHRAVLTDLNFAGLERVTVELDDFERTPPSLPNLQKLNCDTTTFVVSPMFIRQGQQGQSAIQTGWHDGEEAWRTCHFTILKMPSETLSTDDLPPHHTIMPVPEHEPSARVRLQLVEGHDVSPWLGERVADYIRRHGLFKATPPARECLHHTDQPRFKLFFDPNNQSACKVAEALKPYEHDQPSLIVAIGGDGIMLRAIRKHWRERLPFYGINVGHIGFLLNEPAPRPFWERDLRLYQIPLLRVEMVNEQGERKSTLAFNDCWVERAAGQTAWVEVEVNEVLRMPKVVCDGMLIATAAGSTSYARAMRATPLPFNTPLLTLAGSNVLKPEFWQPAVLTLDSCVTLRNLDAEKRPLRGFVDGVEVGPTTELTARVSNIAAVELLFAPEHDPVAKLALLQFPRFS